MINLDYRTKAALRTGLHFGRILWPFIFFFLATQYLKQPESFTIQFVLISILIGSVLHGMIFLLYKVFSKGLDLN